MRSRVERNLREERDRKIAEAYRRGYGKHPQEEWVGKAGLALMEDLLGREHPGAPG